MHVSRIGLTPLKGARHRAQTGLDLSPDGPLGDRVFCLLDPSRNRVLRTVENPTLLQTHAGWHSGVLSTTLPGRTVVGAPVPSGRVGKADYWGRVAALEVLDGPWGAAYSEHLGYDVELARASYPGEVVYGASVTLVTTSSVRELSRRTGADVDSARFRATFTVDTGNLPPHEEDGWVGREIRIGEAEVRVRGLVPRCAVVDLDPATGARNVDVLGTLAGYHGVRGEIAFGVDAVVTRPGRVDVGVPVRRG